MTTLAHDSGLRRPRNGGVAARRAVIRWATRMFRREWRQQILVVTLLTVAVAAAIGSITIAYNSGAADDADHGSATYLLRFDGTDPRKLQAGLAAARRSFGTIDAIAHRSVAVPGNVETVDYRAQDPRGAFGSALLALRRGSYPVGPRQVAVTDGVAELLRLDIGSTLALDDRRRTIVGIVENPRDLSDEFALVSPASAGAPDSVTVLVDAGEGSIHAFRQSLDRGADGPSAFAGSEARPKNQSASALAMFSLATVFLLLASLVAAAGFAVIAQRRLRQLGMLAAIGATQKHLRLVLLTNGAVVGAIGAVIGTVVGLALWLVIIPTLETAFDHRIDALSLPWTLLAMVVLVAVLGATVAAWWPGRAVARVPVMLALSARPPRPKPAHRSAILAALLIAGGISSLVLSDRTSRPLIVAGILATILGTLLLGPLAIRIFARTAGHVPIAARLALRDLARYQARSGAALAAVILALGIAAAVVVTAAAEEKREAERMAAEPPNLSDRQIRVYTGPTRDPELIPLPIQTPAQLARSATRVRQLAAGLDGATVIPLRKAHQPGDPRIVTFEGDRALVAVGLAKQTDLKNFTRGSGLYVATPVLLRHLGIDPATVDPNADFLADPTVPTDELVILSIRARKEFAVTNVQRIDSREVLGSGEAETGRVPSSFVTLDGLRRHGWKQVAAGWLVESSRPLTSEQIANARERAGEVGVAGAYVVLMATYHDDLGYLSDVPVLYLVLIVVAVPLTAAVAGWLLAGREPPTIARPVIE